MRFIKTSLIVAAALATSLIVQYLQIPAIVIVGVVGAIAWAAVDYRVDELKGDFELELSEIKNRLEELERKTSFTLRRLHEIYPAF